MQSETQAAIHANKWAGHICASNQSAAECDRACSDQECDGVRR